MEPSTLIALLTVAAVTLFALGTPILLCIGLWAIAAMKIFAFPLENVGSTMFESLNNFALLAAPLFILTGDLLNAGGIARRMTDFALAFMSWLHGGLAMASLAACGMFAAISGSNSATTATIGSITYPTMVAQGYEKHFAAATAASGGTVGIIIPPSILFIIYGFLINLPIAELFLAGIIPGIMMVLAMMGVAYMISRRRGYGTIVPFRIRRVVECTPGALIGMVAIVLTVYGIYAGVFSPTEASAVTVAYCLFAGLLITRETKLAAVPELFFRSGIIVGILGPMVAVSILMQEVFSVIGAREVIGNFLLGFGGYYGVLFGSMVIVLIGGTLLESVPDTIILAPILAPIAHSVGIDPFHFAVIFLVGDAIGFITPPYGLNLFVAAGITGLPYLRVTKAALPYLAALLVVWVVVALVPQLSLFIIEHSGLGAAGGSRMLPGS